MSIFSSKKTLQGLNTDTSTASLLDFVSYYNNAKQLLFLGFNAGANERATSSGGSCNIFIGESAGYWNSIGAGNLFVGPSAGYNNTIGSENVAVGILSGFSNVNGERNTLFGANAGQNIRSGNNVAVGASNDTIAAYALNAQYNTSVGTGSTFAGSANVLVGKLNSVNAESSIVIGNDIQNTGSTAVIISAHAQSNSEDGYVNLADVLFSSNDVITLGSTEAKIHVHSNAIVLEGPTTDVSGDLVVKGTLTFNSIVYDSNSDDPGIIDIPFDTQGANAWFDTVTIPFDTQGANIWFDTVTIPFDTQGANTWFDTVTIPFDIQGANTWFDTVTIPFDTQGANTWFDSVTIPFDTQGADIWFDTVTIPFDAEAAESWFVASGLSSSSSSSSSNITTIQWPSGTIETARHELYGSTSIDGDLYVSGKILATQVGSLMTTEQLRILNWTWRGEAESGSILLDELDTNNTALRIESNGDVGIMNELTLGENKEWRQYVDVGTSNLVFRSKQGAITEFTERFQPDVLNFTGKHRCVMEGEPPMLGCIVSATGVYIDLDDSATISIDEAIPVVRTSDSDADVCAFGVMGGVDTHGVFSIGNLTFKKNLTSARCIIQSHGEGAIRVCDANGRIKNGDLLMTCGTVPGHAMRQGSTIRHSYTVAKATCDMRDVSEDLIGCVYMF